MTEKTYRSRWILPISGPPIENGWVTVRGNQVIDLGASDHGLPRGIISDLGESAVLPGLINAHTHLEFSDLSCPIGHNGIELQQWVELVIRNRRLRSDPGLTIARGADRAYRGGARLVGEIATAPWAGFRNAIEPEVVVFGEVLGLAKLRADERLAAAAQLFARASVVDRVSAGISPHAPYSTSLETVRRCVELARSADAPLAMHVAESRQERELIENGTGPFAQLLQDLGIFQPQYFASGPTATLMILAELARAPAALVIHGNDLRPSEIDFLATQPQMTVVICPRTHHFFGHPSHPVRELMARGIRVAIGTDSLASNPDLSIWNEVRWLLENRPDIPWEDVLGMATLGGADAFRRRDLGRIEPGASSDLIAVAGNVAHPDDLPRKWVNDPTPPRWLTSG